jgi:hypothetical protein
MTIVLKNQIDASERSAEELEGQFQREHRDAMLCVDVEDLLKELVRLVDETNRHVERFREDARRNAGDADRADVASFESGFLELYRKLDSIFPKAAALVSALEARGYSVNGKRPFQNAARELKGIVCFSPDAVRRSHQQALRGETRDLDQIMHELPR